MDALDALKPSVVEAAVVVLVARVEKGDSVVEVDRAKLGSGSFRWRMTYKNSGIIGTVRLTGRKTRQKKMLRVNQSQ